MTASPWLFSIDEELNLWENIIDYAFRPEPRRTFVRVEAMILFAVGNERLGDVENKGIVILLNLVRLHPVNHADNLDEALPSPEVLLGDFVKKALDTRHLLGMELLDSGLHLLSCATGETGVFLRLSTWSKPVHDRSINLIIFAKAFPFDLRDFNGTKA